MSEDEKTVGKGILIDHLGGLALAIAASFALSWAFRAFGVDGEIAGDISFFVFFVFVFSDPVGAWRGSQSWSKFGVKMGSGLIVAIVLAMIFNLIDFDDTFAPQKVANGDPEPATGGFAWVMLMPMLIIPVVFLGPMIERILSGKGPTGERLTRDDLLIGLTFPLYITGSFALMGLVASALWLVGAHWSVGVLVLTTGVLCALTEAWFAQEGDTLPEFDEDGKWQARAESGAAAWRDLGKAMRTSFASALVLGGKMYATIALAMTFDVGGGGGMPDEGLGFLVDIGLLMGVVLIAALALLIYAVVLAASLAVLLARLRGFDPMATEAFAKQALGRLFMGGMAHVRPDIDEDEATR